MGLTGYVAGIETLNMPPPAPTFIFPIIAFLFEVHQYIKTNCSSSTTADRHHNVSYSKDSVPVGTTERTSAYGITTLFQWTCLENS